MLFRLPIERRGFHQESIPFVELQLSLAGCTSLLPSFASLQHAATRQQSLRAESVSVAIWTPISPNVEKRHGVLLLDALICIFLFSNKEGQFDGAHFAARHVCGAIRQFEL